MREKFAALVGPQSFREIHDLLAKWLSTVDLPSPIKVRNIALDMESTWALIRDEIMSKHWGQPLEWYSLMADGTSEKIRALQNATNLISPSMAETREKELREFCSSKTEYILNNNIQFACRAYAEEPFMHGFLIDSQVLFMGLCSFDGTVWSTSPYLHFVKTPKEETKLDGDVASHFIKVFENWFDSRWNRAVRHIWSPEIKAGSADGTAE